MAAVDSVLPQKYLQQRCPLSFSCRLLSTPAPVDLNSTSILHAHNCCSIHTRARQILHASVAHRDGCWSQAKQHGLPGGEEEEKALEDAAAPTDIPRLFAPGRLLYLSQQGGCHSLPHSLAVQTSCMLFPSHILVHKISFAEQAPPVRWHITAVSEGCARDEAWRKGQKSGLPCAGEGSDAKYRLLEAQDPDDRFETIVISGRMIPDHLCTAYIAALESMVDVELS